MQWTKILAALGVKMNDEPMTSADYEFMKYITEFGKHYGTKAEYEYRAELFKETLAHINEHNDSGATHTLGINHMSDWSEEEYRALLGYKPELRNGTYEANIELLDTSNLADDVNWVTAGAVTPVKNQGQCGSCWAFSTTGSVEGAEFLFGTKSLTSLSEQNLVDCSKQNDACKGGLMDYAFEYIESHPLMPEADYPYTGHHSAFSKCKYEKSQGVGHVKSYKDVQPKSKEQLMAAVQQQPVSIAVEADKSVFQSYRHGVITSRTCGTKLDHGVLAVGYGTEDGEDYFLVKNSWGPSWGDKGYLKIGANNVCGILEQPSYPEE